MMRGKADIIASLQKEILSLQGYRAVSDGAAVNVGLEAITRVFPRAVFPTGVLHEFLTEAPEHTAASGGFIAGLLSALMQRGGACIWISTSRRLFPPALKMFGVEPDRFIFVDLQREKDVMWAMEESLKCEGLVAVIADLAEMSFTQSRRVQLVAEQSGVTCFLLRTDPRRLHTIASIAQWKVRPLPSRLEDGMPGVGFPRWQVELLKVRNGQPGIWNVEWSAGKFLLLPEERVVAASGQKRKAG